MAATHCVTQLLSVGDHIVTGNDIYGSSNLQQPIREKGLSTFDTPHKFRSSFSYELPMGTSLREIIFEHAGGLRPGRTLKAVIPGGISMGLMTESELDTPLDFAGPGKVGCLGLGTAAVVAEHEWMLLPRRARGRAGRRRIPPPAHRRARRNRKAERCHAHRPRRVRASTADRSLSPSRRECLR